MDAPCPSARFFVPMKKVSLPSFVLLVLASWTVADHTESAPEPDNAAKRRAAVYQAETRSVLTDRRWMITLDQPGKLVADHYLGAVGAGQVLMTLVDRNPLGVAHLIVTFEPKTVTNTSCTARVVSYMYSGYTKSGGDKLIGPYPLNNPPVLDDVNHVVTDAWKRLAAAHPEYGAK